MDTDNDRRPAAPAAPPNPPQSPWGAHPTSFEYELSDLPPPSISAGGVIKRSLGVLGDNFFAFFAIAVICYVPNVLWSLYLGSIAVGLVEGWVPRVISPALPILGAALAWLLSGFIAQAVMIGRTVESMAQRTDSLGEAFMLGIRRVPQAIAVSLLATLGPLIFCALGLAALFFLQVPSPMFAILGVAAIFMGTGAIACALYVAVPVVVVERVSILNALTRSWTLTRGSRIIIFAALFVAGLAQGLIHGLAATAIPIASAGAIVDVLLSLLTGAFGATLGAVTYVRLRETSENVHVSALFDQLNPRRGR